MAWYWWVLIVVGVIAIGYLKIKVWNKIQENSKKRKQEKAAQAEDDE